MADTTEVSGEGSDYGGQTGGWRGKGSAARRQALVRFLFAAPQMANIAQVIGEVRGERGRWREGSTCRGPDGAIAGGGGLQK